MFKMIPSYYKYAQEYGALMTDPIKFPVLIAEGDVVRFDREGEIYEAAVEYGITTDEKGHGRILVKDLLFAEHDNFYGVAAYNGKLMPGYTKVISDD